MKLLICTQTVDIDDPILGFFHRWIEKCAQNFESVSVICLREGSHALPSNVQVYSLGKEGGESRVKYIRNFYRALRSLGRSYDRVFVHMNPHYVILGGLWWKYHSTPIFFWRNHARINWMTRAAARFAKKIFYTSPYACTARYKHAVQMPVGIDTEVFIQNKNRCRSNIKKILFLGRVSPVKRIELFISAGDLLKEGYELHIYGDDPSESQSYIKELKKIAGKNIFFHASVKNRETPAIYNEHDLYVNLTPKGSMDKTVLEAVACKTMVFVANESFLDTVDPISFIPDPSPKQIASKIIALTEMNEEKILEFVFFAREKVVVNHSLEKLVNKLYAQMV